MRTSVFALFSSFALLVLVAAPAHVIGRSVDTRSCFVLHASADPVCCDLEFGSCAIGTASPREMELTLVDDQRMSENRLPLVEFEVQVAIADSLQLQLHRRCEEAADAEWERVLSVAASSHPGGSYITEDSRFAFRSYYSSVEQGRTRIAMRDANYSRYSAAASSVAVERAAFGPLAGEDCFGAVEYLLVETAADFSSDLAGARYIRVDA